jgi:hypothetical protein
VLSQKYNKFEKLLHLVGFTTEIWYITHNRKPEESLTKKPYIAIHNGKSAQSRIILQGQTAQK